jgi:hypothetical protein
LKNFGCHPKNCDDWITTIFFKVTHLCQQPKQAQGGLSNSPLFNLYLTMTTKFDGDQNGFGCHLTIVIESLSVAIRWGRTNSTWASKLIFHVMKTPLFVFFFLPHHLGFFSLFFGFFTFPVF